MLTGKLLPIPALLNIIVSYVWMKVDKPDVLILQEKEKNTFHKFTSLIVVGLFYK